MPAVVHPSNTPDDVLNGPGACGASAAGSSQGRCGYGPRLPLLVISPWAKSNFVDHTITDHSSMLRFIENNWSLGQLGNDSYDAFAGSLLNLFDFQHPSPRPVRLDPSTGEVVDE